MSRAARHGGTKSHWWVGGGFVSVPKKTATDLATDRHRLGETAKFIDVVAGESRGRTAVGRLGDRRHLFGCALASELLPAPPLHATKLVATADFPGIRWALLNPALTVAVSYVYPCPCWLGILIYENRARLASITMV